MKKKLYISALLTTLLFCNSSYAIKGTFYNSISNNTGTDFWSGMEYATGSDSWDNCGWWSDSGWAYYRELGGNKRNCLNNPSKYKFLNGSTTIGQTGGHESNKGLTSAHQTFFLDAPKGDRKFILWNDVNGSGDEHVYIKMWCSGKEVLNYETTSSFGGDPALFIKTIFLDSATANKVDLGYIVMRYSPNEGNKPDIDFDLFDGRNGLSTVYSAGYVKECF